MEVRKGARIEYVQYHGNGAVTIVLSSVFVDEADKIVTAGANEHVLTTQKVLSARAVANGQKDGRWSDPEVEEEVRAAMQRSNVMEKVRKIITTTIPATETTREQVSTEEVEVDEGVTRESLRFADLEFIRWE